MAMAGRIYDDIRRTIKYRIDLASWSTQSIIQIEDGDMRDRTEMDDIRTGLFNFGGAIRSIADALDIKLSETPTDRARIEPMVVELRALYDVMEQLRCEANTLELDILEIRISFLLEWGGRLLETLKRF